MNLHDVAVRASLAKGETFQRAEIETVQAYGEVIDDSKKAANATGHLIGAGMCLGALALPPTAGLAVATGSFVVPPALKAYEGWKAANDVVCQIGREGHHHLLPNAPDSRYAGAVLGKFGLNEGPTFH